ncbi:DUF6053 domain-containing protein [Lysobacter enzymogenes]|uniref:DUF6053 domain-containing protein n=1 Tax=Lysobacter enzymogenes TaxID=69 RepID=UPI003D188768
MGMFRGLVARAVCACKNDRPRWREECDHSKRPTPKADAFSEAEPIVPNPSRVAIWAKGIGPEAPPTTARARRVQALVAGPSGPALCFRPGRPGSKASGLKPLPQQLGPGGSKLLWQGLQARRFASGRDAPAASITSTRRTSPAGSAAPAAHSP